MPRVSLQFDCSRCAALCCIMLAFDRSRMFAIDKPAGEPCPNLDSCGRCSIHPELVQRGFPGCVAFDCLGAGQRVTQELFGGRSWRDDPSLIAPMSHAFSALLRRHQQLQLLEQAARLDLSPRDRERLDTLRDAIESISVEPDDNLDAQLSAFLSSLRGYVEGAPRDVD